MSEKSGTTGTGKRRTLRRIVGLVIGLMVVLVLLVVFTPALVNVGVGAALLRSIIEPKLAARFNGEIYIQRIELSWFDQQRVLGLSIEGDDADITLDVTVDGGLLDMIRGQTDPLRLSVGGSAAGEFDDDGRLSLLKLMKSGKDSSADTNTPAPDTGGGGAPLNIDVRLDDLNIELSDARSGRFVALADINGDVQLRAGDVSSVNIAGISRSGDLEGNFAVSAESIGLLDTHGRLALEDATLELTARCNDVPVLRTTIPTDIRMARATITSQRLAEALTIRIESVASIDSAPDPSSLSGSLVLDRPLEPFAIDRITGEFNCQAFPTGLLQVPLEKHGIDVLRDIGPELQVQASISDGPFSLFVAAGHIRTQLTGTRDAEQRIVTLGESMITANLRPELAAARLGLEFDRRTTITIELSDGRFGFDEHDTVQLRQIGGHGAISVDGPVAIQFAGSENGLGVVETLQCAFAATALADGVHLQGHATVDGAEVVFDERVIDLFDDRGTFDGRRARATGRTTVRGLTPTRLARLLPDQAPLIEAAIDRTLNVALDTVADAETMTLDLEVLAPSDGGPLLRSRIVEHADHLHVASTRLDLTVTPELVAAFREEDATSIRLHRPARISAELEPFDVPGSRAASFDTSLPALAARLRTPEITVINAPGTEQPVAMREFDGTLRLNGDAYALAGTGRLWSPVAGAELGATTLDITGHRDDGTPSGTVHIAGADVAVWETMLGREPGSLTRWIDRRGDLAVELQQGDDNVLVARLSPVFERLAGTFIAAISPQRINVDSVGARLSVPRGVIQPASTDPNEAPSFRVTNDLPMELTINRFQVPGGIVGGQPLADTGVDVDVRLAGGPLALTGPGSTNLRIDDVAVAIRATDLRQGATIDIKGTPVVPGQPGGTLDVQATLTDLVGPDGVLAPARARVRMNGTTRGLPAVLVDGAADFKGLLVAAIGSVISADLTTTDFSRSSGTLQASIEAPLGKLELTARGEGNALHVNAIPVRAELQLTPALTSKVLSRINPIFRDIRSTDQPLRATVTRAVIPLDGDVSRLDADIEITLGAVAFDSGSLQLALFALFDRAGQSTVPGFIEPVKAKIRSGVVTYERFAMRIGKHTLLYEGQIDLVNRTLDLRTDVPLESLTMSFKELRGVTDNVIIPIVTRGTLDKHTTQVDPKFDLAGVIVEAGLKGAVDDLLGDLFKR